MNDHDIYFMHPKSLQCWNRERERRKLMPAYLLHASTCPVQTHATYTTFCFYIFCFFVMNYIAIGEIQNHLWHYFRPLFWWHFSFWYLVFLFREINTEKKESDGKWCMKGEGRRKRCITWNENWKLKTYQILVVFHVQVFVLFVILHLLLIPPITSLDLFLSPFISFISLLKT